LKSGRSVIVMKCQKGHTHADREKFNHAMPTPAGYRTALRFFATAERFGLPVLTLVDTVGAWPSFEAEIAGQIEAIATNLLAMAGLKVPMITLVVAEGGSGGALAIAMGNTIGCSPKHTIQPSLLKVLPPFWAATRMKHTRRSSSPRIAWQLPLHKTFTPLN